MFQPGQVLKPVRDILFQELRVPDKKEAKNVFKYFQISFYFFMPKNYSLLYKHIKSVKSVICINLLNLLQTIATDCAFKNGFVSSQRIFQGYKERKFISLLDSVNSLLP